MKEEIKIKEILVDGQKIYFAKTSKFKNFYLGISFFDHLNIKDNVVNKLLNSLINKKTKNYPTETLYRNHLKDLYNMVVRFSISSYGNTNIIDFFASSVNPKYLNTDINLLDESTKMLIEILNNSILDEETLIIEKELLKKDIQKIYDNKNLYAKFKFIEAMFKDEKVYQMIIKNNEEIDQVTLEEIKKAYQSILTLPHVYYAIGDLDEQEVIEEFKQIKLPKQVEENFDFDDFETKQIEKINEIIEEAPINQSILNIGYRSEIRKKDPDNASIILLTDMLGGFAHSSLFRVIREEYGLVYYIGSSYDMQKGTITISCALDGSDYEKCLSLIKEIIEKYQNGQIDEDIFELTKEAIINQIKEDEDSSGIIYSKIIAKISNNGPINVQERIKRYEKVTIADIQRVSQKLKLDTIYLLKGIK